MVTRGGVFEAGSRSDEAITVYVEVLSLAGKGILQGLL